MPHPPKCAQIGIFGLKINHHLANQFQITKAEQEQ
jgi:hypothetical protein